MIPVFGRNPERGSEEVYNYICTFCDFNDIVKEAEHYCAHCDELYCKRCFKENHADFVGHKVVKVSDWGEQSSDKCPLCRHERTKVSKHCVDHNQSCCFNCATSEHSSCSNVFDIDKLASGVYTSKEFNSLKIDVNQKLEDVKKIGSEKKRTKKNLETSQLRSRERLDDFRKKVDEVFDKLKQDAIDEFVQIFSNFGYVLEDEIDNCEGIIANLRLHKMYMECRREAKPKMFMKIKKIRHKLAEYDMVLAKGESFPQSFIEYEFNVDPTILMLIDNIKSLKLDSKHQTEEGSTKGQLQPNISTPSAALHFKSKGRSGGKAKEALNHEASKKQVQWLKQEDVPYSDKEFSQALNQPCRQNPARRSQSSRDRSAVLFDLHNSEEQFLKDEFRVNIPQITQQMEQQHEKTLDSSQRVSSRSTIYGGNVDGTHMRPETAYQDSQQYARRANNIQDVNEQRTPFTRRERGENTNARQFKIRLRNDDHNCNIQGMFGLSNGSILLSDTKNKKLKHVDTNYKVINYCELPAGPRGVCTIDNYQAVTALSNKTLQFVTLDRMEPCKVISLSHDCYGITHYGKKLYVTKLKGKCVYVYDIYGHHLNNISGGDTAGVSRLFSTQNVYITRDGARIYVTDSMKGLVILNANGTALTTISQLEIKSACGVCTDTSGNVYVSGWMSNNVVKFGERGTQAQGTIVSEKNGVRFPRCIWFNSSKSHLIVSNNTESFGSDYLDVFNVM